MGSVRDMFWANCRVEADGSPVSYLGRGVGRKEIQRLTARATAQLMSGPVLETGSRMTEERAGCGMGPFEWLLLYLLVGKWSSVFAVRWHLSPVYSRGQERGCD